jgi:hypothetical protein
MPFEYLSINKFLGQYIQSINDYGIVLNMINVCSNTYPTLFQDENIAASIK